MQTLVVVVLVAGFAVSASLVLWLVVSSIHRHGFRGAIRGAWRGALEELPRNGLVTAASWTYVVGFPAIAVWASLEEEVGAGGLVLGALLWLVYLLMLRWHLRVKAQDSGPSGK